MTALQLGVLVHGGQLGALGGKVQQEPLADVGMSHFAAAEADGDLHTIALCEELLGVAQLDVEVADVDPGGHTHFLDLHDMLILLRLFLALGLLKFELTVVHELADGRGGVWGDFDQIQAGERKELALIVKADVQGSAEAVRASLEKLSNEEVRVRVIHAGVGAINESDILPASTANAIVVGFNVRPDAAAQASAQRANVDIRMYRVIYDAIDEIEAAMKGMLAPKYREAIIGHAEVRQTYKVSAIGTIAGCYVKDGKVTRDSKVRVLRDNIVIYEGEIGSLQRFKDSVKEVAQNYECGMSIDKFNDIKEGDIFECYVMEEIPR